MKRFVCITSCIVLAAIAPASAGTFSFTTPTQATAGTTYITAGQQFQVIDPQFGINESIIQSNQYISADQFASNSDLNSAIATVNSSLNGLGSTIGGFSTSISGLTSSVASLQAGLAHLKSESQSGVSLAAALTPVLPTDGKSNHINFSTANADGFQAFSVNYARVEGSFDVVAGAAFTGRYALAKAGVGYSW